MKCEKCNKDFKEGAIQISHDVPRYMGGKDKDGRHNLCRRCHTIYERIAFSVFYNCVDEFSKETGRKVVKTFSHKYFNGLSRYS